MRNRHSSRLWLGLAAFLLCHAAVSTARAVTVTSATSLLSSTNAGPGPPAQQVQDDLTLLAPLGQFDRTVVQTEVSNTSYAQGSDSLALSADVVLSAFAGGVDNDFALWTLHLRFRPEQSSVLDLVLDDFAHTDPGGPGYGYRGRLQLYEREEVFAAVEDTQFIGGLLDTWDGQSRHERSYSLTAGFEYLFFLELGVQDNFDNPRFPQPTFPADAIQSASVSLTLAPLTATVPEPNVLVLLALATGVGILMVRRLG